MSRILVIDDDRAFRNTVRRFLENEGHEVIDAENGEAGLAMFHQFAPELVVTDMFMPGIGGMETIQRIREENSNVKIIAVSGTGGFGAATLLTNAEQSGADSSLVKPFRRDEFVKTVELLLPKDTSS